MAKFDKWNNDALKRIYKWYYGSWPGDAKPDWDELNELLNRMMVATVQCSEPIGWIEDLWKSTVTPPKSVGSLLTSVAKKWAKRWAARASGDRKVYKMCKDKAALNFKHAVEIAIRRGSWR